MSFYKQARSLPKRFRLVLASFLKRPGLPFADALTEEAIQKAFDEEDAGFADDQEAVYTPAITLWAFLSQVLFKDEQRSCVSATNRLDAGKDGIISRRCVRSLLLPGPCRHPTSSWWEGESVG